MDINKVKPIHLGDIEGETYANQFENIYKKIGKYIINNAETLSKDICEDVAEVNINIKIPADYFVTINKEVSYLVLDKEEGDL